MQTREELFEKFGTSEHGNYTIVDTIGVPHPYCIGPKHVIHASDHFSGRLGKEAIMDAERKGIARCMTPRCSLSYEQHEQALLVSCKGPLKDADGKANPELHAYLLKCKPLCEAEHFAGFAFIEAL